MNVVFKAITGRPRMVVAVVVGVVAWLLLNGHANPLTRGIAAWDIACLVYIVGCAVMFATADRDIADDAERQQEGEWAIFWITVGGVFASFAAIIGEFAVSKDAPAATRGAHVALVAATLLLSWLMTHTLFAQRYAHEYYERSPGSPTVDKGLEFPGEGDPDYWDFVYFAIVLGMTFQVSDVQITSRKLRRLATAHGLLGFLFNTVILALSVNIGSSLLG